MLMGFISTLKEQIYLGTGYFFATYDLFFSIIFRQANSVTTSGESWTRLFLFSFSGYTLGDWMDGTSPE